MKRTWFVAIALSLVAAIAIAAGRNTFLIDNFNDGDANGWDLNDFTGWGTTYVSSGAYTVETTQPIPVDDLSVGTVETHWLPSLEAPRYATGTMRATLRANTDGTTAGFLIRDRELTESDYGFYGSTAFGTFYIERFEFEDHPEAPQTIIAMADPDETPFVVGETYNLEGSVVGDLLMLKAWPVGDPEPVEPTLVVEDKVLKPGFDNRISVLVFFDAGKLIEDGKLDPIQPSGTFDDITFTPGAGK